MDPARVLRYARQRAGLSQRALAELADVPQPSIARIERGASSPRVDTLDRLLRACGLQLEAMPLLGVGEDPTLFTLDLEPAERLRRGVASSMNLLRFRERARQQ